jgi:hypothetical protein
VARFAARFALDSATLAETIRLAEAVAALGRAGQQARDVLSAARDRDPDGPAP